MGAPIKLMVKDQPVFICCKGCKDEALAHPDKTLAKVETLKKKAAGGELTSGEPRRQPGEGKVSRRRLPAVLRCWRFSLSHAHSQSKRPKCDAIDNHRPAKSIRSSAPVRPLKAWSITHASRSRT